MAARWTGVCLLAGLLLAALVAGCGGDDDTPATPGEGTKTTVPGISRGGDAGGDGAQPSATAGGDGGSGSGGEVPNAGPGEAGPYTYTFDGAPGSPQSMYWME